jgi:hypothetical protein
MRKTTALSLTAAVLGGLAVATPAAAVPGLVRVSTTSPSNSAAKTANAFCPAGTAVLGGGGAVSGSAGQVGMDIMLPLVGSPAYSVTGREDETGVAGNWSVTADAVCAPKPAGLTVVTGSTPAKSGKADWLMMSCPAGKQVVGVGGAVVGASRSDVILEELIPETTTVKVGGVEDGTGFAGTWSVHAVAICANPLPGRQRVLNDSPWNSATAKSVSVTCPAGKRVHGLGAEILGGDGEVRLTAVRPVSATTVTAAAGEDEDGHGSTWTVRAYAVCAT